MGAEVLLGCAGLWLWPLPLGFFLLNTLLTEKSKWDEDPSSFTVGHIAQVILKVRLLLIRFFKSTFSSFFFKYMENHLKYWNNGEVFLWVKLYTGLVKFFSWKSSEDFLVATLSQVHDVSSVGNPNSVFL